MNPDLGAERILEVLNRQGVEFIVIGAFAAIAQGVALEPTHDLDMTPRRTPENLERLSRALDELGARIRVADEDAGLPFSHDAASLAGMEMLNLTCPAGDLDLVFHPAAAPAGFDDLVSRAVVVVVASQEVRVASVADILRSKEEAGREKDLRALPALRRFVRGRGT